MASLDTAKALEGEVLQLYKLVQRLREELAGVAGASAEGKVLDRAADQLNAIAAESEHATQSILDATEKVSQVSSLLRKEIKYAGARHIFDKLDQSARTILENCQVHDIIGQRISRIVRTLNAVEGTISALVVTVGEDSIKGLPSALIDLNPKDGELSLHGPALDNDPGSMDQAAIDNVFKS